MQVSPNVPPQVAVADAAEATGVAFRVAAALPGPNRLAAVLAELGDDVSVYEASVRRGRDGALSAGRMMIERASYPVVEAIAAALGVELPAAAATWYRAASDARVPMIAGWDRRGDSARRCVKVYVNASDASTDSRRQLCGVLLPDVVLRDDAPAVIGMNACADGTVERKLYEQAADAVQMAAGIGRQAQRLAAAARRDGADAGAVLSLDVCAAGALEVRAFFVALREPPDASGWPCVRTLPGYDAAAIGRMLPFAPAPPRSIGIAPTGDEWTLYCKPRGSGRAPEALEPKAVYRCAWGEVGVFVEPNDSAPRAFRRTARHAISVRIRRGDPPPEALEALVDWFTGEIRKVEQGDSNAGATLAIPPAPWRLVEATSRSNSELAVQ